MKTNYIKQSKKCHELIKTIRKLEIELAKADNPMDVYEIRFKIKTALTILHEENSLFIKMITIELK